MRVPGLIVASRGMIDALREEEVPRQVANVATLPGIVGASLAMPDIHWGYGFPVGGVAAFDAHDGVVSPGGIGFDINCGIRLVRSSIPAESARARMAELADALFSAIPAGVGGEGRIRLEERNEREVCEKGARWAVENGYGWAGDLETTEEGGALAGADFGELSERARQRGKRQLGTLGSGNHFVEVDRVEEVFDGEAAAAFGLYAGQLVFMIHSGSRGLGYQVADDHLAACGKAAARYGIALPDRQLACAPLASPEGKAYLASMAAAANYAWANRQVLTHLAREAFERVFRQGAHALDLNLVYDTAHNIAKMEEHTLDGRKKRLCVHRKGATRAFPAGHEAVPARYRAVGQPVIIPGDMGRSSWVLAGSPRAMDVSWGTSAHGAGRLMSRTAAMKAARGRKIERELLDGPGVILRARERGTVAEEMPEAYKDVDEVVEVVHNAGLARKVARLKPMGVVKG
jgi:tRNA-splicing ligase RtcB